MGAAVLPYLPAIGGVLQGIGSGITGQAQAKQQKKQTDNDWKLQSGAEASKLQHEQDTAPLRDRAMYLLQQRLGQTPSTFAPHDLYNQSTSSATPQYGGYNQSALAQANQAYQPGMGGVNTAVNQQAIGGIGYQNTQSNPLQVAMTGQTPQAQQQQTDDATRTAQLARLHQVLGL